MNALSLVLFCVLHSSSQATANAASSCIDKRAVKSARGESADEAGLLLQVPSSEEAELDDNGAVRTKCSQETGMMMQMQMMEDNTATLDKQEGVAALDQDDAQSSAKRRDEAQTHNGTIASIDLLEEDASVLRELAGELGDAAQNSAKQRDNELASNGTDARPTRMVVLEDSAGAVTLMRDKQPYDAMGIAKLRSNAALLEDAAKPSTNRSVVHTNVALLQEITSYSAKAHSADVLRVLPNRLAESGVYSEKHLASRWSTDVFKRNDHLVAVKVDNDDMSWRNISSAPLVFVQMATQVVTGTSTFHNSVILTFMAALLALMLILTCFIALGALGHDAQSPLEDPPGARRSGTYSRKSSSPLSHPRSSTRVSRKSDKGPFPETSDVAMWEHNTTPLVVTSMAPPSMQGSVANTPAATPARICPEFLVPLNRECHCFVSEEDEGGWRVVTDTDGGVFLHLANHDVCRSGINLPTPPPGVQGSHGCASLLNPDRVLLSAAWMVGPRSCVITDSNGARHALVTSKGNDTYTVQSTIPSNTFEFQLLGEQMTGQVRIVDNRGNTTATCMPAGGSNKKVVFGPGSDVVILLMGLVAVERFQALPPDSPGRENTGTSFR